MKSTTTGKRDPVWVAKSRAFSLAARRFQAIMILIRDAPPMRRGDLELLAALLRDLPCVEDIDFERSIIDQREIG